MDYEEFIASKKVSAPSRGMLKVPELSDRLFDYQKAVTEFLLTIGSGAAFLDTGMGKTIVALEYAKQVIRAENKPILMLAPLAVGKQHVKSAEQFGYDDCFVVRNASDVRVGLNITNYENMHNFCPSQFCGVILDESSILKSFNGATSRRLIAAFANHRWRLALTATPSPNDHMELGQHSSFLGVMPSHEMLARWFIADQKKMGAYRLKRHGINDFWSWVASWARCACKPSDLGYSDVGFTLAELIERKHLVRSDISAQADEGMLFRVPDMSATSIHKEKRITIKERAAKVAELVGEYGSESIVVWCDTDYEADALKEMLPQAIEVRGSMKPDLKEEMLDAFTQGQEKLLITKPKVAGFGLNWQHCNRTIFAGLSFSYEQYYQAIRRFHRFGQQRQVTAEIVMTDTESCIWQSITYKKEQHIKMKQQMAEAMKRATITTTTRQAYLGNVTPKLPTFIKGN